MFRIFALLLLMPQMAMAVVINFDSFTGVPFTSAATVPEASRLSDQLLTTTGAVFSTVGEADYVAIANLHSEGPLPHAPSGTNGIGGVRLTSGTDGYLTFATTIAVEFFSPASPGAFAVTDFVSITGDLRPNPGNTVTLQAFDIAGNLIGSDTRSDISGTVVSVAATGIHRIMVSSNDGTVAFDDLTFNAVTEVPEPAPLILLLTGLGFGLMGRARSRRRMGR